MSLVRLLARENGINWLSRLLKWRGLPALFCACCGLVIIFPYTVPAAEEDELAAKAQRFLDAYPDFLVAYDAGSRQLIGWDGRRFLFDDGQKKDFHDCLESGQHCPPIDLEDTLNMRYRTAAEHWPTADTPPQPGEDAGGSPSHSPPCLPWLRHLDFLAYVYGSPADRCSQGGWQTGTSAGEALHPQGGTAGRHLTTVTWRLGKIVRPIRVSRCNGLHRHLQAVIDKLDGISDQAKLEYQRLHGGGSGGVSGYYQKFIRSAAGRHISPHAFGNTVDIHWQSGRDYWRDTPRSTAYHYHSAVPQEIVEVFEQHGFIWGGHWRHFDGMHFEYRPELLGLRVAPSSKPCRPSTSSDNQ